MVQVFMKIVHLFFIVILLTESCHTDNNAYSASKKFAKNFDRNKQYYMFIKKFMFNNSDSINAIRMYPNMPFTLTKKHLTDVFNNYIEFSINDTINIKNNNVRKSIIKLKKFMINQNICLIITINNYILISFVYDGIPCYELYWENNLRAVNDQRTVIIYKTMYHEYWKYYLDANWYLKGIPCFN